jgi:glycosyltransferase involved in cell wall biosynthesis
MNVAIFASAFYPATGGVEELVRQLCHEFTQHGISPIVLTNRWPRSLPAEEVYEGIPVYRLAMRMPEWNWRVRLVHAVTFPFTRRRLLAILRRHRADVIHVQCAGSNGLYALAAQRALGLPLVLSAQGERTMDASHIYDRLPSLNRTLRDLIANASFITACSKDTLADLEQWWGQPFGPKASVMYNGIRPDDFETGVPYSHPRPYILGIGRVVAQKGFDVLIDAFAEAQLSSHDLLIAGEGPEQAALARQVQARGLEGRVHFLGRVDRPKAVALFKGSSFFVLPSRMEPFGIVNLEAMAAGKAVVASRVGGVPEVVRDGESGLLIPPADVPALAAALRQVGTDDVLRERLGAAGRKRVLDFTWPAIARAFYEIYALAMQEKTGTPNQLAAAETSGAYV